MQDLLFFIRLFKPYQSWLIAGVLLSVLTAAAGIVLLTLSGWFISSAALMELNYLLPAAQIRGLAITRTLGRYGERVITHEATFRVLARVRIWFFAQMIPLATGRLALLRSGDVLARMTSDIDALDALYLRLLAPITVAIIGVSAVLSFIYQYQPILSFNLGLLLIFATIAVPLSFNRLGENGAKAITTLTANFKTRQIEILQGLRELVVFAAYERFQHKLTAISERLIETQRANNCLTALSSALTLLISQLSLLLTLILTATALQDGLLTPTDCAVLVFCIIATFELITPLAPAMQMLGKVQQAAHHIRTTASLSPAIEEPAQTAVLPQQYDLTLENISFHYPDHKQNVISNVSLVIPQGSKIGIIGESGAGKTSLLQLLLRFFDPQQGRILLAGQDYKNFHSDDLLSCFGLLSQRSQLFASTIRENLLLGKPSASDAELQQAIAAAGLTALIARLPEGLDTWVGEQGLKVSGGEARRIALARVYLKNAPILLLDEPTEGLDSKTEEEVLAALAVIAQHKTLIMVTHRSAGLKLVDKVYHFSQGQLQ